jgi:hypothetical protein
MNVPNNNYESNRRPQSYDDSDNVTIIFLESENDVNQDNDNNTGNTPNWMERIDDDTIFDERRRTILLSELKRIQRSSFLNFVVLCAIPVILFTVMVIIVLGHEETCISTVTQCVLEPRTFVNAFTTRCICDPIPVERNTTLK